MNTKARVFFLCVAVLIALTEATALTLLPEPWRNFHPVLDIIVLCIVIHQPKAAGLFAVLAGSILDAFSVGNAAFALGRLIVVTLLVFLVSETVFTNRSLYAAGVLVIGARMFDRLWRWFAQLLGGELLHWSVPLEPFISWLMTLGWDVGFLSLAFVVVVFFTRRFLVTVPRAEPFYERS